MAPDFKEAQILEDGVIVPLGNPKERPKHEVYTTTIYDVVFTSQFSIVSEHYMHTMFLIVKF